MSDNFSILEIEGGRVLFVNSEEKPYKEIPLNVYQYRKLGIEEKIQFYRLYKVLYLQEKEEFGITHSLFDWKPIKVKIGCEAALKQMCDAMEAAQEFIV